MTEFKEFDREREREREREMGELDGSHALLFSTLNKLLRSLTLCCYNHQMSFKLEYVL